MKDLKCIRGAYKAMLLGGALAGSGEETVRVSDCLI